jgi:hypothetical protein
LLTSPRTIELKKVCIVNGHLSKRCSIRYVRFRPPYCLPSLCHLYHPVHLILLSCIVYSSDSMHQTLPSGMQSPSTMHLHYSVMLRIVRCTSKQPHHPKTPLIECMKSWCSCDLKFESNFHIHCNLPAHTVPVGVVLIGLITNSKTPCPVGELAIARWFHSGC